MTSELKPLGEKVLLERACRVYTDAFAQSPAVGASAPGRVNLIGEHVDYCEGFVLPVTIPFKTVVVGSLNNIEECRVVSILPSGQELKTSFKISPLQPGEPAWANYIKGVVANFPGKVSGFDAAIVSDVPVGSGLSSSASLEVAVFTLLEVLLKVTIDPVRKAQLCQKAEHEFPGMPCGIMDQYVVTLGKKDHALLIDCRSLEATHVPVQTDDTAILVINSNVKHQLTGSEYPQRRAQCQKAADLLGIPTLRSASVKGLEELKRLNCDEVVLKRARHIVEEIHRTTQVAEALRRKDLATIGSLFYQSHESLSRLMEVSCPELDQLVSIAREAPGVYGARMTGGGFGGCAIILVKRKCVEELKSRVLSNYKGNPTFFICEPSDGAHVLNVE